MGIIVRIVAGAALVASVQVVQIAQPHTERPASAAPAASAEALRLRTRTPMPAPFALDAGLTPVRRAALNPHPAYQRGKLIEVSIDRQELTAWKNGRVVMSLDISSGRLGSETPRGSYRVTGKLERGYSRIYDVEMPWMLAFHGNFTIHQVTPARDGIGWNDRDKLGTPASAGCVRVDVDDAERLYQWAPVGTPVWIH